MAQDNITAAQIATIITDASRENNESEIASMLAEQPAAKMADVLESLPPDNRFKAWQLIGDVKQRADVVEELKDDVRMDLIEHTKSQELTELLTHLPLSELAQVYPKLPEKVTRAMVNAMDQARHDHLQDLLHYTEDTVGSIVDTDIIAVRSDASIKVVLHYLRTRRDETNDLPESAVMIVDNVHRYLGILPLNIICTAEPTQYVKDLYIPAPALDATESLKSAARKFEENDWLYAPVVDQVGKLLGIAPIDEIVDYIRDEREEEAFRKVGMNADEDIFSSVFKASRHRGVWLMVNLFNSLIAAKVISLFNPVLDAKVALAFLLPMVAGIGGTAAMQSSTLVVRSSATGQIGPHNIWQIIWHELMVGLINGIFWATVAAGIIYLWFQDITLCIIIAAALVINFVNAGLSGTVVPVLLGRIGVDPAIASSAVVTALTDIIGFAAFLGLATLLLL